MSETAIFIVGIVIFAITIYGTVMAGGIALNRVADDEDAREPGVVDAAQAPAEPSDR
jgi:hypothetical protein